MKHLGTLVVAIALATTASLSAQAATYYVNASRPDDSGSGLSESAAKKSIKAAVNAAKAAAGDHLILVKPGTYTGADNREIEFGGKNIQLRSTAGAATTIIDLAQSGRFLYLHNNETKVGSSLEGFTIQNGNYSSGTALTLSSAGLTIKNCIFKDNRYTGGGAVSTSGGDIDIVGCKFINNSQASSGGYPGGGPTSGGALISNNGTVSVTGSEFIGNTGYNGGAILSYGASFTIRQSRFSGNTATGYGGALYVMQASSTAPVTILENSLFTGNTAASAGGFAQLNGTVTIKNCTIYDNITNGTSSSSVDLALNSNMSLYNTILIGKFSGTPGTIQNCCTNATVTGAGNLNVDPQLTPVGWLTASSPCINAGSNANAASPDLAGQARPQGGTVDIGCYEWKDTDGDGIPDAVETAAGLNPNSAADASGDADNDGLSNLQEFLLGTDPGKADTDGDGIADKAEIDQGYDPLKYTRIIYVNAARPDDSGNGLTLATAKKTIAAAVDLSKSNAYENIIKLKGGTYTGASNKNLDFAGCNIKLMSIDGAASTIIDLENSGRFLYLQKGETTASRIDGLTIKNGSNTYGAAVYLNNAGLTIRNCVIENCTSSSTGGGSFAAVYASGKPVIITGTVFRGNSGPTSTMGGPMGSGGALVLTNAGPSEVSDCTFQSNMGYYGGGIYVMGSQVVMNNNRFLGNVAGYQGGAVYVTGGMTGPSGSPTGVTMTNCLLLNNRAQDNYSDLYVPGGSSNTLTNLTVAGGSAKNGISCDFEGNTTLTNCIIQGQIKLTTSSSYTIAADYNCTTTDLSAKGSGNIMSDPALTRGGYLKKGSSCINAGTATGAPARDIDGVIRPVGARPDIGCQEFKDTDNDGIPDNIETAAGLNASSAADATLDKDGDGLNNLNEYYSGTNINKADTDGDGINDKAEIDQESDPLTPTRIVYVNASGGNDSNSGTTAATAKKTINAAIAVSKTAGFDNVIKLAAGTYSGDGNHTLDFGGYDIKIQGAGAASTIIDLGGAARFLTLQKGESLNSQLKNMTFRNGYQSGSATVVYANNAQIYLRNCIFADNHSGDPNASGGTGPGGGASYNTAAVYASGAMPVKVVACSFVNNCSFNAMGASGGGTGGAIILSGTSTGNQIDNCTFTGNYGYNSGAIGLTGTSATVTRCRFYNNLAAGYGGAVYVGIGMGGPNVAAPKLSMVNCILIGNRAQNNYSDIYGAGTAQVSLSNVTIAGGSAKSGGSCYFDTAPTIINTILQGDVVLKSGVAINGKNNCVSMPSATFGTGSITADPMLTRAGYLKKGSPCIDAGSSDAGSATVDIDGVVRPAGAAKDIGAQEFKDTDNDGIPDNIETAAGLNPSSAADATLDKDNDGLNNLNEYYSGTDINKADTDGDGVNDGAETAAGTDPLIASKVYYVNAASGNDNNSGLTTAQARKTIGAALALTRNPGYENVVKVMPGTYVGDGNHTLDFNGYDVKLLSTGSAADTIVDLGGTARFLTLQKGESLNSVLNGFTIRNGHQDSSGTAIYLNNAQLDIRNCVFDGNFSGRIIQPGDPSYPGSGSGAAAIYASGRPIRITNTRFFNNRASGMGSMGNAGALCAMNIGDSIIDRCEFIGNDGPNGGAIQFARGTLTVTNSKFLRNRTDYNGGAINAGNYMGGGGTTPTTLVLKNCLFLDNKAKNDYSDLYSGNGTITRLVNVTISRGGSKNGGSCYFDNTITIDNSIVNGPAVLKNGISLTAKYSQNPADWSAYGAGNITADPMLYPCGYPEPASPVVNAGKSATIVTPDLDGTPRVAASGDMGCYEWKDSDGDGIPDAVESAAGLNPNSAADKLLDKDNDGIDNLTEFRMGTRINLADSDGDGINDGDELALGYDPVIYTRMIYVDASDGSDGNNGLTAATAKKSIGAGVANARQSGCENVVKVLPGTYAHAYDKNLNFGGYDIKIQNAGSLTETVIDLSGEDPLLTLNSGETAASWLDGFLLTGSNGLNAVITLTDSALTIKNCRFAYNNLNDPDRADRPMDFYYGVYGMVRATNSELHLEKTEVIDNVQNPYGNFLWSARSDIRFDKCRFQDNDLGSGTLVMFGNTYMGGPSQNTDPVTLTMSNTVFARNNTRSSGPVIKTGSNTILNGVNCSLVNNANGIAPVVQSDGETTFLNSIITDAVAGNIPSFSYCCTAEDYSESGTGNIVYAGDLSVLGYLNADSACIDAGTAAGAPPDDIIGTARPQGNGVDIGAEEFCDANHNGISDYYEYICGGTLAPNADDDGDGLTNLQEYQMGLDASNPDTDWDGMPDGWEAAHGLNPFVDDSREDPDGDGLMNVEEYVNGTDPHDADTDHDGRSDGWEVKEAFSNPLTAEFTPGETVLQSINGNGFSNSAGGWENEGNSTFARGRRGWVQYNFNIAAAGVYVIDVEIAERIDKTTPGSFQIAGYVDGAWSATRVVEVTHGTPQKLEFFLPKLAAGSHTLKLDWLNVYRNTTLQINKVRVLKLNGKDTNNDGVADWVDTRMNNMCNVTVPATTPTSPVCIEGANASYIEQITITGYYTPDGQTPEPPVTRRTAFNNWYADVPLNPNSSSALTINVAYQNGAKTIARSVSWTPTDAWNTSNITIRKNDSLRLAVTPPSGFAGTVTMKVEDQTCTVAAGQVVPYKFENAGRIPVTVTCAPTVGAPETRTMTVNVMSGTFNPNPVCAVGVERQWPNADLGADVYLEFDYNIARKDRNPNSSPRVFTLSAAQPGTVYVTARTAKDGPILDTTQVRIINVTSHINDGYHRIITDFGDGTALYEGYVVLDEVIPGLQVKVVLWGSNTLFEDGTREKWFDASSFDASGEMHYRMLAGRGFTTCQSLFLYQDGVLVRPLQ